MMRWMCGVTKMDRNERNRPTTNGGETFKKVRERRLLKWYGHFMRRDKEYVAERVIRVDGRRRKASVNVDLREK